MFKHTQSNHIHIDDVVIPLELFLDLFPEYELPMDCISRIYIPGKSHFIFFTNGTSKKLPNSWTEGDNIIYRKCEIKAYLDACNSIS